MDGRITPGDRLVYVNDVRLDNASLDTAVQTLKCAPFGRVRVGIARPVTDDDRDDEGPCPKKDSDSHAEVGTHCVFSCSLVSPDVWLLLVSSPISYPAGRRAL